MTKPYWFKDVLKQLQKSWIEETNAAKMYKQRALQARQGGYSSVADMYDHIRREEEDHAEEITEAIKDLHF